VDGVLSRNSCTPDSPTIHCPGTGWKSLPWTGILASSRCSPCPSSSSSR
jgi:hypothetical protein